MEKIYCFVRTLLLSVGLVCVLFSCKKEDPQYELPPSSPEETVQEIIIPEDAELEPIFSQTAGTSTIEFTATGKWTASVSETKAVSEWLSVSPTEGEAGDIVLTVTVSGNETADDREGFIKIRSGEVEQTVAVVQKQKDAITLSKDSLNIEAEETRFTIPLQGNMAFTAEISDTWIRLETAGTASEAVFIAEKNDWKERRAEITLRNGDKSETITVVQKTGEWTENDIINIPDENFKTYLVANFDTDGDGEISIKEAAAVTEIKYRLTNYSPESEKIRSLEGIQYFTELTTLDCSCNLLSSLDISHNLKLTKLVCTANPLDKLDVSNNMELSWLECSYCKLASIDISHNSKLYYFVCAYTSTVSSFDPVKLTSIDLSHNPELSSLILDKNQLPTLDLSNNVKLGVLGLDYCQLENIDVSCCPELEQLTCVGNPELTTLDVSNNPKLTWLFCDETNLTTLDVSNNSKLQLFTCSDANLTTLNLGEHPEMTRLYCYNNKLTDLNVTGCPKLKDLNCNNNLLTSLNLSSNSALQKLNCSFNKLSSLDVSNNSLLSELSCCSNDPLLQTLYMKTGMQIEGINVNLNPELINASTQIEYKN